MEAEAQADLATSWRGRTHGTSLDRVYLIILPRLALISCLILFTWGLMRMPSGTTVGPDFVNSWAGSSLALKGDPAGIYNEARQWAAEKAALHQESAGYTCWFYPPTFIVIDLPLALMPYRVSLAMWLLATLAAYCCVMWAIVPGEDALWIALAFPGVALNALAGQNGFLTTALFGAGLVYLRSKPQRAGAMFGLLTFKPQMGLLVPLVLIARWQWRAFFAASCTAIGFAALSMMMFGIDTWRAFFHSVPINAHLLLGDGAIGFAKMQSVYAAARLLGARSMIAYALQIVAAVTSATITIRIWRSERVSFEVKAAAVAAGTLLMTPYVMDYDLMLLALPIAWMVRDGMRSGFLRGEKLVLFVAWLLPLFARWLAQTASIPLAPAVIVLLLIAIARRAALYSDAEEVSACAAIEVA